MQNSKTFLKQVVYRKYLNGMKVKIFKQKFVQFLLFCNKHHKQNHGYEEAFFILLLGIFNN